MLMGRLYGLPHWHISMEARTLVPRGSCGKGARMLFSLGIAVLVFLLLALVVLLLAWAMGDRPGRTS